LKRLKEFYRHQYELWVKERDGSETSRGKKDANERPQSFTDRIAVLLSEDIEEGGRRSRRRR
jgi:hypothetical protein